MHTGKSSLRLLVVLTCFVAVLWIATACGDGEFKDPSTLCKPDSSTEEENLTIVPENTDEHILDVRTRYKDLIRRQPNHRGNGGPVYLEDENGEDTEIRGIIVWVTKKVDQSEIPAEDRIPDCLEGVPVQIIEEEVDNRLLGGSQ